MLNRGEWLHTGDMCWLLKMECLQISHASVDETGNGLFIMHTLTLSCNMFFVGIVVVVIIVIVERCVRVYRLEKEKADILKLRQTERTGRIRAEVARRAGACTH